MKKLADVKILGKTQEQWETEVRETEEYATACRLMAEIKAHQDAIRKAEIDMRRLGDAASMAQADSAMKSLYNMNQRSAYKGD